MPKVSVIIPTYNCAKYLPDAIESVLVQSYQDFEIIIVNDGSTDNTDALTKPYREKYPAKIRYFSQGNKGLAATRNVAIDHSKGEYIALLDSDDCFLPHRLESGVKILDAHPDIALTHANIKYIDEQGGDLGVPKRNPVDLSGFIFDNILLLKAHISLPTILVRRECFERYGNFDEHLSRLGCEDREIWLRMAKGCKFFYQDTVLACYRIRQQSMSRNLKLMTEARAYVLDKHCPVSSFSNRMKRRFYFLRLYRQFAGALCEQNDFSAAAVEIKKAIREWPFSPGCWMILLKCLTKMLAPRTRKDKIC